MTNNNEAFEKWYHQYIDNGYSAQAFEVNMFEAWQAATVEANKRIEALESEVAELKVQIEGLIESGSTAMTSLKANNHDLREDLQEAIGYIPAYTVNESVVSKWRSALTATPAESLKGK